MTSADLRLWPMLVSALLLAGGLVLFWYGSRGRRVGSTPFCRRCGFNLSGRREGDEACSECGASLSAPGGVIQGHRHRRPVVLALAILLLLAGGGGAIVTGYDAWRRFDFYRLATTGWLLQEVENTPHGQDRALRELYRRIEGDRSQRAFGRMVAWLGRDAATFPAGFPSGRETLLVAAIRSGRLEPDQITALLDASLQVTAEFKTRLRRAQTARMVYQVDLSYRDRFRALMSSGATGSDLETQWEMRPVQIGGIVVGRGRRSPQVRGSLGSHTSLGFTLAADRLADLPDGRHDMVLSWLFQGTVVSGQETVPFTIERTVRTPVVLLPADAMVDAFVAPAELRDAMYRELSDATVDVGAGGWSTYVLLRFDQPPPLSLAMEVFLRYPGAEEQVGRMYLFSDASPVLHQVGPMAVRTALPDDVQAVDVVLRPSQAAVDQAHRLRTYWGEPIVLERVPVRRGRLADNP